MAEQPALRRGQPVNSQFEWQPRVGPFRRITTAQARQFDTRGAFVVENAFSATEVAEVVSALDPLEAQATAWLATQPGGAFGIARAEDIVFSAHVVAKDARLHDFARHPVLLDLVHDLIGPSVRLYWDQLVYKKGNTADEFPWHQDNGYTFVLPEQYLTCWVALTDATVDNGCPWVVPGGHLKGTLGHDITRLGFSCFHPDDAALATAEPLELSAGSIAVFSSLTPHRTGANTTQGVRKSYILQYAPDGAMMHPRDAPPVPADNAQWQFVVLRDGQPIGAH